MGFSPRDGQWTKLWAAYPPGSFLYDHWIPALLAAAVLAIAAASVLYSAIMSDNILARMIRAVCTNVVWRWRFHVKAAGLGYGAAQVVLLCSEKVAQEKFVEGYVVGWIASVLVVWCLDAVSDALRRPSTFTPRRTVILLGSLFGSF